MEATPPEVTTIIPTRDREDWLPRTLVTALGQEGVETEVIVVDDGSRTPVTTLLAPEPGVRVIRHEGPRGPASARNTGIAEARGRWVALLDDDDLWAPVKLRRELDVAAETGADFVFCRAIMADREGLPIGVLDPPEADRDLHLALLRECVVPISSLLVKTDVVRSLGGFDSEFVNLADWDFLVRLSAVNSGAMTREALVGYTVHEANLHQDESILAEERKRFERKHAEEWARSGVSLDEASWLRWRAGARRAGGRKLQSAGAYLKLGWLRRDPGLAVRGVTLALGGERAMRVTRGVRDRARPQPDPLVPPWLTRAANPSESFLRALLR